jgi:hypothetical protein
MFLLKQNSTYISTGSIKNAEVGSVVENYTNSTNIKVLALNEYLLMFIESTVEG